MTLLRDFRLSRSHVDGLPADFAGNRAHPQLLKDALAVSKHACGGCGWAAAGTDTDPTFVPHWRGDAGLPLKDRLVSLCALCSAATTVGATPLQTPRGTLVWCPELPQQALIQLGRVALLADRAPEVGAATAVWRVWRGLSTRRAAEARRMLGLPVRTYADVLQTEADLAALLAGADTARVEMLETLLNRAQLRFLPYLPAYTAESEVWRDQFGGRVHPATWSELAAGIVDRYLPELERIGGGTEPMRPDRQAAESEQ